MISLTADPVSSDKINLPFILCPVALFHATGSENLTVIFEPTGTATSSGFGEISITFIIGRPVIRIPSGTSTIIYLFFGGGNFFSSADTIQ